jgi:hypothetical protein
LTVYVAKIECLPKMDFIGTCDAFYEAEFNKVKITSETFDNNQNPKYYNAVLIPFSIPCIHKELNIRVYDADLSKSIFI